ncbi:MAG: 50S ribosomal protein L16 [Candidatus Aenigmatarchaeota archaeon]
MGLRPAKCYKRRKRAYTRISMRKPRRSYVKGVPDAKIHRFEAGDPKKAFSLSARLVARQGVQIRHNAMEATRIAVNRLLEKDIGKENYFFKILIFPHQVMRENPLATGAGADRFQTGMRKAFGKPIGKAASVRPGQNLLLVRADKEKQAVVKKALKMAASKLPTTSRIVFD